MVNNDDEYVGYIRFSNWATYTGKVLGSYTVGGIDRNFETSDILPLQSYSIKISTKARNIKIFSFYYDIFLGYKLISRNYIESLTKYVCFDFYGTTRHRSFRGVPCTDEDDNGDIPDCNKCSCCYKSYCD